MNYKATLVYTEKSGNKREVSEYHLNREAAYFAIQERIRQLGITAKIDSVKISPVIKHLELVENKPLSQVDSKYGIIK